MALDQPGERQSLLDGHCAPPLAELLWASLAGWVIFLGLGLWMGPDINVDSLNYHFYLGDAFRGDRVARDFLGASIQGYLSPYAYVPLSWMYRGQWTNLEAILFIASLQSLVVPALWMVCSAILPGRRGSDVALRMCAVCSGLASPLILSQIASTFIDLGSAIPVVLACAILLWALRGWLGQSKAIAWAGALGGLAVVLKFTNAPVVLLMAFMLVFFGGGFRPFVSRAFMYGAALGVVSVLGMAHWSWALWREYQNPLFPFFNHFFRSGDFSENAFIHLRFVPRSLGEFMLRPVLMMDLRANIFTEIASPDARPLLLMMASAILCFSAARARSAFLGACLSRPLAALLLFLAISWAFSLAWSGNGRYFMPGFLLIGPALVCVVCSLRFSLGVRRRIGLAMILLQIGLLSSGQYRWSDNEDWTLNERFIEGQVPPELASRPVTYITVEKMLHSQLSLSAHIDSSWINLMGSFPIEPTGPGSERVIEKLAGAGEIRVLLRQTAEKTQPLTLAPTTPSSNRLAHLNKSMALFGLQVRAQDCLYQATMQSMPLRLRQNIEMGYLYCPATYSSALRRQSLEAMQSDAHRKKIEMALDSVEKACPKNLTPTGSVPTSTETSITMRFYPSTDAKSIVSRDGAGEFISLEFYGQVPWVLAGSLDDVISGKFSPAMVHACSTRQIAYERPRERK